MLEKLLVEDFQNHVRTLVEFDPHLTTLVGRSDSGKSAIVRALIWLMTNQPRGDYFIRHGEDKTTVSLWLDGHIIHREKGKGRNIYQLDNGTFYEAFGTGVPDEIANLINIGPSNLQRQLDSPFLLSLSPGEASRELNAVVNLDLIDSVLSTLANEHKKAKTLFQDAEDRLAQARHKKKDLEWVKQADKDYQDIEKLEGEITTERDDINDLTSLVSSLEDIDLRLNSSSHNLKEMEDLVKMGEEICTAREDVDDLRALLNQINKINEQTEEVQEEIVSIEKDIREQLDGKCPICGADRGVQL